MMAGRGILGTPHQGQQAQENYVTPQNQIMQPPAHPPAAMGLAAPATPGTPESPVSPAAGLHAVAAILFPGSPQPLVTPPAQPAHLADAAAQPVSTGSTVLTASSIRTPSRTNGCRRLYQGSTPDPTA